MAILIPLGVDQTTGKSRTLKTGDTLDGGIATFDFLNVGVSTTSAVADGDIAAGDGTRELFWDASAGTVSNTGSVAAGNRWNSVSSVNGSVTIRNENSNTGASAIADVQVVNDGGVLGQLAVRSVAGGSEVLFSASGGPVNVGPSTSHTLTFRTAGVNRWRIGTTGNLIALTDNTIDIGAGGATRPRTIYLGTSLNVGNGITPSTSNGNIVAGSSANNRMSWTDASGLLSLSQETASTNDVATVLQVLRRTSGTPAIGFGADIEWAAQASGGVLVIATAEAVLTNVTNPNETADLNFYLESNGSSTLALTLRGSDLASVFSTANGASLGIVSNSEVLLTTSGATVTTTGLIPVGVKVYFVVARVITAVTTSSATNTFDVGDSGDPDRYGAAIAGALNTTVDETDATADPEGVWSASGREIILDAAGAETFTAGAVRVTVFYTDPTAPTS